MEQDQHEFEKFYVAARDYCLQVVLISVGDRQLGEDLVADAFTGAWMSWPRVCEHPAPRAWVVRTALNTHVSWWRRHRREVALGSHDAAAADSQYPSLDSSLIAALQRLPARQREVIVFRLPECNSPPASAGLRPPAELPRRSWCMPARSALVAEPAIVGMIFD